MFWGINQKRIVKIFFFVPKAYLVTLRSRCLSALRVLEMQTSRYVYAIFTVNWETCFPQPKGTDHTGLSRVTGSSFQLDHYCSFLFLLNFEGSSSGAVALTLSAVHVIFSEEEVAEIDGKMRAAGQGWSQFDALQQKVLAHPYFPCVRGREEKNAQLGHVL